MRVQHIAGDLLVDFKVGEYEIEGVIQVRASDSEKPGLSIHTVALGFDAVKAVIEMAETEEWKKHFPDIDDDAS